MKVKKINYRDQIREIILNSILKGQLALGEKLSLAEYAKKLDTSVTPIREAFTQLEIAGILESIPNVGFCIKTLSHKEAAEIYTLIGVLEAHALHTEYSAKIIDNLLIEQPPPRFYRSPHDQSYRPNDMEHTLLWDDALGGC
jgi:DNA-binding GntR family transcriptional regulator